MLKAPIPPPPTVPKADIGPKGNISGPFMPRCPKDVPLVVYVLEVNENVPRPPLGVENWKVLISPSSGSGTSAQGLWSSNGVCALKGSLSGSRSGGGDVRSYGERWRGGEAALCPENRSSSSECVLLPESCDPSVAAMRPGGTSHTISTNSPSHRGHVSPPRARSHSLLH